MPITFQGRRLNVYLPEDYDGGDKRYPVVYVQDGGDLINPQESGALQQIRELEAANAWPGLIFVGVEPFDRNDEYTPFVSPNIFDPGRQFGGNAADYADYLAGVLKPYIDSVYRTLPGSEHTGIAGFSLGGLISVYTALRHPGSFGRIASFSGSFWFPGIVEWVEQHAANDSDRRLFMNVGDGEGAGRTNGQQWMVENNRQVFRHMMESGLTDRTAKLVIYESEYHSFEKGVRYMPEAMRWLFGQSS